MSDLAVNPISDIVKGALVKASLAQLMAHLASLSVVFTWPVINPVVSFLAEITIGFLVDRTAMGLSLLWVTLEVQYESDSVERATKKLKLMLENPERYTDEQKRKIEKNFDASAVALIRLAVHRL